MSFTFSFGGDDIESSEEAKESKEYVLESETLTESTSKLSLSTALLPAQKHDIGSLLADFPRQISYSSLKINTTTTLPRREVWDIKHQLMSTTCIAPHSEEEPSTRTEDAMRFLEKSDVIEGLYEGGFKTWECSLDLTDYLSTQSLPSSTVELGCGTALPSSLVLLRALQSAETRTEEERVKVCVQDFNLEVLQLSTLPNLFLVWYFHHNRHTALDADGDVEVTDSLISEFTTALDTSRIELILVSGSWSREMAHLMGKVDLILASETIYSPNSLPSFVSLLDRVSHKSLIAAKRIYFGVGGGVEQFKEMARKDGFTANQVFDVEAGVGRVILSLLKS